MCDGRGVCHLPVKKLTPVGILQDKALTIWLASPRPVYIGRKFFKQGIVDLAWAPDGRTLLACSTDGTVACFQFGASELGEAVPQEARLDAHLPLSLHIDTCD